jgi:hypothetical protein
MRGYNNDVRRGENLIGNVFGKLTVLSEASSRRCGFDGRLKMFWNCKCVCGNLCVIRGENMRVGKIVSCGCTKGPRKKHGKTRTPVYQAYRAMLVRCDGNFPNYGARGITVCDRWRGCNGFVNFLADMGERPSLQHTIDRIDCNGNYCPENCRWAEWKTQQRNRRNNRLIEFRGETRCLAEWCEVLSVPKANIYKNANRGVAPAEYFERFLAKRHMAYP